MTARPAPEPLPVRKPKPIPPPMTLIRPPERELLERLAAALTGWTGA